MSNLAIAQSIWSDLKHVKGENVQYTQSTCKKYMYILKEKRKNNKWLCSGHTQPKLPFLTMQLIPQGCFSLGFEVGNNQIFEHS